MNFLSTVFWGVKNPEFTQGLQQAVNSTHPDGIYAGDNLFTIGRNLSFLENSKFMTALQKHGSTKVEEAIMWRIYVLAWAAKNVVTRGIPGDLVECCCYKGVSARIICDYIDFEKLDRTYFLYDLFEHDDSMPHHSMPEHSDTLYEEVKSKFSDFSNVVITQGEVPSILEVTSPSTVSFLHIDMNNAAAEVGALEVLFDRLSPGGIMVLDDYGWLAYREQKLAEDTWLAKKGYEVLELPTGQGLVFK